MNSSLSEAINYLAHYENIYIMDNHRLATWCWLQHIDKSEQYTVLHIDYHYDTNSSGIEEFKERLDKKLFSSDLNSYIDFNFQILNKKYFISWDNYLPIFHQFYSHSISKYILFVNRDEFLVPEIINPVIELKPEELLEDFCKFELNTDTKWIINIDLDYFFLNKDKVFFKNNMKEIISSLCSTILRINAQKKLNVLTIALSPDIKLKNNGWDQSLDYLMEFEKYLKLPIANHLVNLCLNVRNKNYR